MSAFGVIRTKSSLFFIINLFSAVWIVAQREMKRKRRQEERIRERKEEEKRGRERNREEERGRARKSEEERGRKRK